MSMRNKPLVFLFFALFISQNLLAQPKDNSPYSRMGIGDLTSQAYTANLGWGGISAAYNDPYQTNALNPASLGYLQATSYEFGFNASYTQMAQGDRTANAWSGNLKTISLAFPVFNPINAAQERVDRKMKWGMQFGVSPYSSVGYSIQSVDDIDQIGSVDNRFTGEGGTYRLNWGNGFNINNFAFGINVNRYIGNINNTKLINLPTLNNTYINSFVDDFSVRSWQIGGGFQYTLNLKKETEDGEKKNTGNKFILGAYGNVGSNVKFNVSQLYTSTNLLYPTSAIDTLIYSQNEIIESNLPASYTVGFIYQKSSKLRLGLDFSQTFWSEFVNPLRSENLSDANRINGGIEYTPDANSYNSFAKRVRYRAGFVFENDYRVIDTNLRNIGITLGVGLPIRLPRQQVSAVNLSLELGQFGNPDQIMENYAKLNIGFTLNDNLWFFKRKFY
jgi:hypothetical protein